MGAQLPPLLVAVACLLAAPPLAVGYVGYQKIIDGAPGRQSKPTVAVRLSVAGAVATMAGMTHAHVGVVSMQCVS